MPKSIILTRCNKCQDFFPEADLQPINKEFTFTNPTQPQQNIICRDCFLNQVPHRI